MPEIFSVGPTQAKFELHWRPVLKRVFPLIEKLRLVLGVHCCKVRAQRLFEAQSRVFEPAPVDEIPDTVWMCGPDHSWKVVNDETKLSVSLL